ncbi:MAG TPA: tetratricopeptide repeat protein [Armatimonadota bacterium]|jgi:tetratricopeptide (TPR) repeat protein|nr:tetratricopeptide repeat protein [Armatimonadota bacterium]HOJ22846.1 tetratricopeptide repeat protein [Armatimonadota bacterium]HOM81020.1 tetratricopeptide repeat protein [Armatimonadota bacterium]HOQ28628.1 tetratricopeptide repeat protein [Armatimonadota bacterium]HPO74444.1 tetratricopeptide repeat protein [Armatimonadota bacterium]
MQRLRYARIEAGHRHRCRVACAAAGLIATLVCTPVVTRPAHAAPADPEATATAVLDQVVDGLWERSDHFFHHGDYETTTRINRLVVRMDPHFVEGLNTLAWLLRQGLNRPQEALALHHRAIRDNPERWEAFFDLGMFHFDRKDYPLAAHYFRRSVELEAPAAKQHMLAHTYEKMGRTADALRAWRAIVEKFPDDQPARRNLERLEKEE